MTAATGNIIRQQPKAIIRQQLQGEKIGCQQLLEAKIWWRQQLQERKI